jgi:hypothetical protein
MAQVQPASEQETQAVTNSEVAVEAQDPQATETLPEGERATALEGAGNREQGEDLFAPDSDVVIETSAEQAAELHEILVDKGSAVEVVNALESLSPQERERVLAAYETANGNSLTGDPLLAELYLDSERALIEKAVNGDPVEFGESLEAIEERVQDYGTKLGELLAEGKAQDSPEVHALNQEYAEYVESIQSTGLSDQISNFDQLMEAERLESARLAQQRGTFDAVEEDLNSQIRSSENTLSGSTRNLEQLNEKIEEYEASWSQYNPWASNFWREGEIEAARVERDQLRKTIRDSRAHLSDLRDARDEIREGREEFETAVSALETQKEALGQEVERLAELSQTALDSAELQEQRQLVENLSASVQENYQNLEQSRVATLEAIPGDLRQRRMAILGEYAGALRQSNKMLGEHIELLNKREQQIELARNTTIIIGAAVATGGLASGSIALYTTTAAGGTSLFSIGVGGTAVTLSSVVGAGTATTVGAVALGTATATTAGALSNTAEATGHVAYGDKGAGEAFSDALDKTGTDFKNSAISSVSAVSGMGAGNLVRGGATTLRATLAAGATTGGTNAAVNYGINTADQYRMAVNDFSKQYGDSSLSDEQLQEVWQKEFAEPRGLTSDAVIRNGVITVAAGTLSGGAGAGSGVVQETSKTITRRVGAQVLEETAGIGIGVGSTYLQNGKVTTDDLIQELGNTLTGTALGRMQVQPPDGGAPRADSNVDTDPTTPRPVTEEGVAEVVADSSIVQQTEADVDGSAVDTGDQAVDSGSPDTTPDIEGSEPGIQAARGEEVESAAPAGEVQTAPGTESSYEPSRNGETQDIRTASGLTGEVTVSDNGRAVYTDSPEMVQELFAEARFRELMEQNPGADADTMYQQAQRESVGVSAFRDSYTDQIVIHKPADIVGSPKDQRVLYGSYLRHEEVHRQGGNEVDAWRAQEAYMNRNGYEMRLDGGAVRLVEAADPASPVRVSEEQLDVFLRRYDSETETRIDPARGTEIEEVSRLTTIINRQLEHITPEQLEGIVGTYPPHMHAEVIEVLSEASRFANMYGLEQVRRALPGRKQTPEGGGLYVPGDGSLADIVAYGSQKNKFLNGRIQTTDQLGPDSIVLLDRAMIERMQTNPEFAVEVANSGARLLTPVGMNDGLNLFNQTGPGGVEVRLEAVMDGISEVQKDPQFASATPAEVTREYFVRKTEEDLALVEQAAGMEPGTLATQIRNPKNQIDGPLLVPRGKETMETIALQLNGYQGLTNQRVDAALQEHASLDPQLAMQLLEETTFVHSPRSFTRAHVNQRNEIVALASELGIDPQTIRYFIPETNKSYDISGFAHREANPDVPASSFVNPDTLLTTATGGRQAVVILDDFSGTGNSVRTAISSLRASGYDGDIIVAPLVSTTETGRVIGVTQESDSAVHLVSQTMLPTFRETDIYRNADPEQQAMLTMLAGNLGHGDANQQVGTSVYFPHMSPNNNHGLSYRVLAPELTHNGAAAKPPSGDPAIHRNQQTTIANPRIIARNEEIMSQQVVLLRPETLPEEVRMYLGITQAEWYSQSTSLNPAQVDPLFFEVANAMDGRLLLGGGSDLTQLTLGVPKRVVFNDSGSALAEINRVIPKPILGDFENKFGPNGVEVVIPEWQGRPGGIVSVDLNAESAIDIQHMVRNSERGDYVLRGYPTTANAPLKQAAIVEINTTGSGPQVNMYFRTPQDQVNYDNKQIAYADSLKFEPTDWVNRSGVREVMLVENVAYAGTLVARGQDNGWTMQPESLAIVREMVSRMPEADRMKARNRIASNLSSPESANGQAHLEEVYGMFGL